MKTKLIENRQIRIFISSTFRDMHPERDYLINKIFPALKKYCQERDVTLVELDLRWGVSEEASKQGKVVEICLQEIENTHPFFIGLLGERYGWTPSVEEIGKNPQIQELYPWITSDLSSGRSITDIEMQYGVLRSRENINAYFYLRSPEMPTPKEFKEEKGSGEEQKLNRLKGQIRSQEKYPVKDYASVEELGRQVEEDFKQLVDTLFPQGRLSEVEKERLQQKAFLKSRTGVYISSPENDKRLNGFMADNSPVLVITGESGLGKSALIANWIAANEGKMKGRLIYHFVGNSGLEGDYRKITQRLINEIKEVYGLSDEENERESLSSKPSASSDRKKEELEKLLLSISGKERLLIVLDGVNQLAERDSAKLLNWLPAFPGNVKVIYSTLPADATMAVFKQRGYPVFTLQPLNTEKREELIRTYLNTYGKSLSPAQEKRIALDRKCENTLVLRTLLDELRVFGVHEEIDRRISDYLSTAGIPLFFDKVLTRIESAYNYKGNTRDKHSFFNKIFSSHKHDDDANFVGDVFSLIAVSRAGLSETELLKLTGAPPLYWVQLYNAIAPHLTVRDGLITFSHNYFRESVRQRYLNSENERSYRRRIVQYCEKELSAERSARINDEFPYQLHQLYEYDRLYSFLLDFSVFDYIDKKDSYELGEYWRTLISKDKAKYRLRMYLELKTDNREKRDIARLYNDIGVFIDKLFRDDSLTMEYNLKALAIRERVLETDHPDASASYNNIGSTYDSMGNYPKALEYYLKALAIKERVLGINHPSTATSYGNIGGTYCSMGDYQKALEYCLKALAIRERVLGTDHPNTATSYNNIGGTYMLMINYPKALEYYLKALAILERVLGTDHPSTATSYNNVGCTYDSMGNYPKALEYNLKALAILERVLGTDHPDTATSYNSIGCTYDSMGNYPKALEYYQKSLAILERVLGTDHPSTATSYNNIGFTYNSMGNYPKALEYYLKALAIRERVLGTDHPDTAISYNNIGEAYCSMGNYPKALEYFLKALAIRERVLGTDHPDTAISYNNIGYAYDSMGNYPKALECYQKALAIRERVFGTDHPSVAASCNNIGYAYDSMGNYSKALEYFLKVLAIRERVFGTDHPDTAISYNEIGFTYYSMKNYPKTLEYLMEALVIRERVFGTGHPDTADSYDNIGIIYESMGNYPKAAEYRQKAAAARSGK
ncbi:MAG: tetratricopeptide repeat protein [Tannerella sp.]|jgi:tetratricopeptide (TPR) repeat protein|nr:tetratricopeptide repeat protein [Tannerella sp.]